ncbi:MAG: hypothetical protein IPO92_16505 [Saprospiraceae bacterium]|nr:hypothetical protein [Saprospiraceae bacterium]
MQFSLTWPTDKLQLIEVPKAQDILIPGVTIFDQTQLASGHLGFIWETDDVNSGTTLSDGTIIYKLTFKLLGANNSAVIESSVEPKISKFLDVDVNELNMQ